jgi:lipoyl(octanoyl) transferase
MQIEDLGRKSYKETEEIQLTYFNNAIERSIANQPNINILMMVEHDTVYTLGKNGDESNILEQGYQSGVPIHKISRGGDITYHGPGQLVIYPIFDLKQLGMGLAEYVSTLETIGIKVCEKFGVKATTSPGENGVWIDVGTPLARKIMAIGIKASRFVTMHGLAFNVDTDLSFFGNIVPCGIQNKGVTTLQKECSQQKINLEDVKKCFVDEFKAHFVEKIKIN